jgi:hypothetical protein
MAARFQELTIMGELHPNVVPDCQTLSAFRAADLDLTVG